MLSLLLVLPASLALIVRRHRRRQTVLVPLVMGAIALAFLVAHVLFLLDAFRATALAEPSMKATVLARDLAQQACLAQLETLVELLLLPIAWLVDRWLRARAQH